MDHKNITYEVVKLYPDNSGSLTLFSKKLLSQNNVHCQTDSSFYYPITPPGLTRSTFIYNNRIIMI